MNVQRLGLASIVAALICLIPPYWISISSAAVGLFHDDGIYVATGQAIANGHGYTIESYPGNLPQTKYPPVLPVLLSFVWRIEPHFPQNIWLLKAVPLAGLLAWLALSFAVLRRYGKLSLVAAAWCILFIAASQWTILSTAAVLSETIYSALCLAALIFLARDDGFRSAALAGAFAGLAYLTRTAGIAIIGACFLTYLMNRKLREMATFALISGSFVVPWLLWQHHAFTPLQTAIEVHYTAGGYRSFNVLEAGLSRSDALDVLATNLILLWTFPLRFFAFPRLLIVALLAPVPFWWAAVRGIRVAGGQLRGSVTFVILNATMLIGCIWEPDRYMLPEIPILAWLVYAGTPQRAKRALVAFPVWLVFLAYFSASNIQHYGSSTLANPPWERHYMIYHPPVDWAELQPSLRWITENTKPSDVIVANYDPAIYLYSGRQAIRPFESELLYFSYGKTPPLGPRMDDLRHVMKQYQAGYLLVTSRDKFEEPVFPEMIRTLVKSGELREVFRSPQGPSVYKIVGSSTPVQTRSADDSNRKEAATETAAQNSPRFRLPQAQN